MELIWWSQALAEQRLDEIFRGEWMSSAEAIHDGVILRTRGRAAEWQERLQVYPAALAADRIERAAETWGGYAPEAVLTVTRSDARLARVQRMVGDAERIVQIVFALNRTWEPSLKWIALAVERLEHKPERLPERLDEAFARDDFLALTELALETVRLAPDGPNVVRARAWLAASADALRR